MRTDRAGNYLLRTVLPQEYSEHGDDPIGDLLPHDSRIRYLHLEHRTSAARIRSIAWEMSRARR